MRQERDKKDRRGMGWMTDVCSADLPSNNTYNFDLSIPILA
jgi:hypothetical protein